jgi:hypothetical protein
MSDKYEVISAFLDDELFESSALAAALSEAAGRDLLIELIALRHLAQADSKEPHGLTGRGPRPFSFQALVAVAAVLVALVGGYLVGDRRSQSATAQEVPAATRVVQTSGAWQVVVPGRM